MNREPGLAYADSTFGQCRQGTDSNDAAKTTERQAKDAERRDTGKREAKFRGTRDDAGAAASDNDARPRRDEALSPPCAGRAGSCKQPACAHETWTGPASDAHSRRAGTTGRHRRMKLRIKDGSPIRLRKSARSGFGAEKTLRELKKRSRRGAGLPRASGAQASDANFGRNAAGLG